MTDNAESTITPGGQDESHSNLLAEVIEHKDTDKTEQEKVRTNSDMTATFVTAAKAASTPSAMEPPKQAFFCFLRGIQIQWSSLMDVVRAVINGAVLLLSHHAASHPIRYIVGTVVLSMAILGVGLGTNFDISTRVDVGLTPFHSVINEQKQWILDDSGFPSRPHSVRVLIHKQGASVVSRAGVVRAFEVIERVRETDGYLQLCEDSLESNKVGYSGLCHIRGVPLFWNNTREIFEDSVMSDVDVLLAISAKSYPDTSHVEPLELMGHMETHRDHTIVSAESFLMEILIPRPQQQAASSEDMDDKVMPLAILETLLDLQQAWIERASNGNTTAYDNDADDNFRLEVYFTDHSLEAETLRAVMQDLPLIAVVFVIMALFTMAIFSVSHKPGGDKKCKQRIMLGLGAVSAVFFSMATSYGLLFIIGIPFTSTTQILPFIVFGIGLDDAFVIFGEFARTDDTKDPVERIQKTMEEVGLSVFLTTLTTSCAFALGCLASLPNLYWLSLYAFPTIIVDFFVMITFFVAIIVVDERRIKQREQQAERTPMIYNVVDACFCRKAQTNEEIESMAPEKLSKVDQADHDHGVQQQPTAELSLTLPSRLEDSNLAIAVPEGPGQESADGELDREGTLKTDSPDRDERHESVIPRQPIERVHSLRVVHHHVPGPPGSVIDLFMKWYAAQLLRKPVKIFVLIVFVVMTAGLAYSASKFTQEFNIYEVLSEDSYVAGYFSSVDQYADRGFVVPEVYFRNVNQSDPIIQKQMEEYIDDLVDIDSITGQPPFFWLRHFKEMLAIDAAGDDQLKYFDFNVQMDIFLFIPVFKMLYGDHIIRDPDTGDILASRCVIYMDDLDMESVDNQIQAWRDQLDVTIEQPINSDDNAESGEGFNFFMWEGTMLYVFEFYQVMVDELISSSIVGWIAVTFISFAFLPHWSAALVLSPIMAVLYIDLIGFLQLCQVHLNAISYFVIVMSVGLLVDFNMHILLRYYESPCATRDNKVKDALQTMGSSVVIGGLSTFLGVVPLLFSTSYLMLSLFFGFWGMVILGILHGCCFLPVFLSICGPLNTGTAPIAAMTPDGIAQARSPERGSFSVPTSDSSARPHLGSDGELSDPVAPKKHINFVQVDGSESPSTITAGVPASSKIPTLASKCGEDYGA